MTLAAQAQYREEAGMEVLTRGPVHEAFAGASRDGVIGSEVIARAPYETIIELPPEHRPEGNHVAWIPGYWSWDDERSDYLWVSGVWRDVPPGRQWVPGYWATVRGGSQWVSGFWGNISQTEVVYLPPPPATLETGPNTPPSPGNQWMPGCWVWQQTRYDWQPGYWVTQQADWVWCPPQYTWTPRGYVYVQGYWDYDIARRGVNFAPVYYSQPVYRRQGYAYSPNIIIDIGAIALSLFVQSRSSHYYFGDYYDQRYEQRGFRPWYAQRNDYSGVDPIYAHYRYGRLQNNPQWDSYIEDRYRYRRDHIEARPAQTLNLQININNTRGESQPIESRIGRRFEEAVRGDGNSTGYQRLDVDERKQYERRGRDIQELQRERKEMEQRGVDASSDQPKEVQAPVRMPMRGSPIGAKIDQGTEGRRRPPPQPNMPEAREVNPRERKVTPTLQQPTNERPASQRKPGYSSPDRGAPPERGDAQSPPREEPPGRNTTRKSAPTAETQPVRDRDARPMHDENDGHTPKGKGDSTKEHVNTPARKKGALPPEVQLPAPRRVRGESSESPPPKERGTVKESAPTSDDSQKVSRPPKSPGAKASRGREPAVGTSVKRGKIRNER